MNERTIENLRNFLMRCELRGNEVPAFNEVMVAVEALARQDIAESGEAPTGSDE